MLSNQGPHLMEARVSLFNLAGDRLDAPPVTLLGTTAYEFDLREWAEAGGVSFHEGSLQVHYIGMPMELAGVVKLVDAERSLIFDEELTEPVTGSGSSRLEGVWWLRSRKSELHIAVSNTTERVITATITAIGGHLDAEEKGDGRDGQDEEQTQPQTMVLAAHETRVLDVRTILSRTGEGKSIPRIGGISIAHTGPNGGVLARSFIQEPATGFSNSVEFHDPQTAKTWQLNGAGLRIGSVASEALTQIAVARNIGGTPTVLKGHVAYALEDGTQGVVDIPEMQLAPGQTRAIPLAKAIQASGISGVATAGLEFEYSGVPGSIVMSALSVSSSGNQVFRVPMIDATSTNSAGTYPWSIDDTSSSFVYIKNVTDLPQRYTMTIRFEGGSYSFGLRTLGPHQTVTFDLRKLRDTKVPDVNGKTLPPEATHGQVHWSIHEPHNWLLIGRVEQADLTKGLSMTASCTCCGNTLSQAWITPSYVSGNIGGSTTFLANETDYTCYGPTETFSFNPYNWSSDHTSVATVDGSSGQATAVGVGSAGIWGHWYSQYWFVDESAQPPQCIAQSYPVDCSAQCDVKPRIDSINPTFLNAGDTGKSLTIHGAGFGSAPTVQLPSGVSNNNQQDSTDSTIVLPNVSVAASSYIGVNSISVTANGVSSDPAGFAIDGPDHMIVQGDVLGNCSGCTTTVKRVMTYQVIKFSGSPVFVIPIGEVLSVSGWNCNQSNPGFGSTTCSSGEDTDTNGEFADGWTLSSDSYTPVGCGFGSVIDHWQWCAAPKTIGTPAGYAHTNAIQIQGSVRPPGSPIPNGTIIAP